MIMIAVLVLLAFLLFSGVGFFIPWTLFRREATFDRLLSSFWVGWVLILAVLQVWNLFLPVALAALILFAAAGLVGWFWARESLLAWLGGMKNVKTLVVVALAIFPAFLIGNHVMFHAAHADHAGYHMQVVKWISSYAIVPGLGNLQHRLAFNNANFLNAALLNAGVLYGYSYYLSGSLMAYGLVLTCGMGIYRFFYPARCASKTDLFYALMTPLVIWEISVMHVPGYSPDIPVFALQVILAGELLKLFETSLEQAQFVQKAAYICLLAAAGIAIKMSFVIFGGLCVLVTLGAWIYRYHFNWRTTPLNWFKWLWPAALVLLVWMARSVILSGYPFYPSSIVSLPFPWIMPKDIVDSGAALVSIWARTWSNTIPDTHDWSWFLKWYKIFNIEPKQAFTFALALMGLDGAAAVFLRRKARLDMPVMILVVLSAVSLVFWFVMAPDYRFAGANFWILLVSAFMLGYQLLLEANLNVSPRFLALAGLLVITIWISPNNFSNNLSPNLLLSPVPEYVFGSQAQERVGITHTQTPSGITVYFPSGTVQECWDAPLPCTTRNDIYPGLKLFEPGNLQKGFYVGSNP